VRLVSSWMTVISSCSWSNHRFRKKFQLLLAIVHPLCSSMHVVRPSVVCILVLPRRSSQSSDSARILTYPSFDISWSKNQFMPNSACTCRSGRSRVSSTASGLEGASHCIRLFIRAGPFLLDAFPRWSGLVFNARGNLTYVLTIFVDMSICIVCNGTEYLIVLKTLLEHYRAYI